MGRKAAVWERLLWAAAAGGIGFAVLSVAGLGLATPALVGIAAGCAVAGAVLGPLALELIASL